MNLRLLTYILCWWGDVLSMIINSLEAKCSIKNTEQIIWFRKKLVKHRAYRRWTHWAIGYRNCDKYTSWNELLTEIRKYRFEFIHELHTDIMKDAPLPRIWLERERELARFKHQNNEKWTLRVIGRHNCY
jgi:hypothetical protein